MNDVSAQEALALFFVRLLNKPQVDLPLLRPDFGTSSARLWKVFSFICRNCVATQL